MTSLPSSSPSGDSPAVTWLQARYLRWTAGPACIRARYGTARGMVRLWLSRLDAARGAYRPFQRVRWESVRRLVFVCRGNICRSAYAAERARALGADAVSFGFRATEDGAADPAAQRAAARRGLSLARHRAAMLAAYRPAAGDLLLAMEADQARRLAALFPAPEVQVTLLGLWCRPKRPHLADPKNLSDAYFDRVCGVMDDATAAVVAAMAAHRAR